MVRIIVMLEPPTTRQWHFLNRPLQVLFQNFPVHRSIHSAFDHFYSYDPLKTEWDLSSARGTSVPNCTERVWSIANLARLLCWNKKNHLVSRLEYAKKYINEDYIFFENHHTKTFFSLRCKPSLVSGWFRTWNEKHYPQSEAWRRKYYDLGLLFSTWDRNYRNNRRQNEWSDVQGNFGKENVIFWWLAVLTWR